MPACIAAERLQRTPATAGVHAPLCLAGPGRRASGANGSKRKQKSAARGANGGKLAPGEKRKLKRAKLDARRAARSVGRGFDLHGINRELMQFVASGEDMKVGPYAYAACKHCHAVCMSLCIV